MYKTVNTVYIVNWRNAVNAYKESFCFNTALSQFSICIKYRK